MATGDKRSVCRSVDKTCPYCGTSTMMLEIHQDGPWCLECGNCGYEEAILGEKTA